MLKKLDEVQKAITGGDSKEAAKKLRDLQKQVQEKVREGKMDTALADQDSGWHRANCQLIRIGQFVRRLTQAAATEAL